MVLDYTAQGRHVKRRRYVQECSRVLMLLKKDWARPQHDATGLASQLQLELKTKFRGRRIGIVDVLAPVVVDSSDS